MSNENVFYLDMLNRTMFDIMEINLNKNKIRRIL